MIERQFLHLRLAAHMKPQVNVSSASTKALLERVQRQFLHSGTRCIYDFLPGRYMLLWLTSGYDILFVHFVT